MKGIVSRKRRGHRICGGSERIWSDRLPGNVADIMITGIFILAMAVVMLSFLENMKLIQQKTEVSQLARSYILRMETTGYLREEDRVAFLQELAGQGVTNIDLSGTTLGEVGYGGRITLRVKGTLGGKYEFTEQRVSTAKH